MSNRISGWIQKSIRNLKSSTRQGIHATVIVSLTFASTLGMAIPTMVNASGHQITIKSVEFTPNPVESEGAVNAKIKVNLDGGANWKAISVAGDYIDDDCITTMSENSNGDHEEVVALNASQNNTGVDQTHNVTFTAYHANNCGNQAHQSQPYSSPLTVLPTAGGDDDPDPTPLDAPTLLSPEDGVAFQSSDLPKPQTWEGVEGASSYYYESCDYDPGAGVCDSIVHDQPINDGTSRNIGTTAPEGTFWWRVAAVDSDGNQGPWSETREFTIVFEESDETDTEDPDQVSGLLMRQGHSVNGPIIQCDGGFTNTTEIRLEWDASKNENLSHYNFYHVKSLNGSQDPQNMGTQTYRNINMNPDNTDGYLYAVTAVDTNGNESEMSQICDITLDTIAPIAKITSPADGDILSSNVDGDIELVGEVTDENPMNTHFEVQDEDGNRVHHETKKNTDDKTHTLDWDISEVDAGKYTIYFEARDKADNKDGNRQNPGDSVDVIEVIIDNELPSVNAGEDQVLTGNSTQLEGEASDDYSGIDTVEWTQTGGPGNSDFGNENELDTNVTVDEFGIYTYTLTVTDMAGNLADDTVSIIFSEEAGSTPGTTTAGSDTETLFPVSQTFGPFTPVTPPLTFFGAIATSEGAGDNEDEGSVLAEEDEDEDNQPAFTTANGDEGEVESESAVANLFNWWWILLLLIIGALGYFLYSRRSSDRS